MATQQSKAITLKGSVDIVADFFVYGINNILYLRGLYAPETFTRTQNYGLTLLVTADDDLKNYLNNILADIKDWLYKRTIQKLVLVIKNLDNEEVVERWQFNVQCNKTFNENDKNPKQKDTEEVKKEIQGVLRQITASVSFLPMLDFPCSFDILVYTDKDLELPTLWNETGPALVADSQEVRLRSFSTMIHKVDSMVTYKTVTD